RLAIVGVPARMPNPSAHEIVPPRYEIGIMCWSPGKEPENFIAYLRCATLIGIDAQNPLVSTCSHGLVSQLPKPFKWNLHHPCAHSFRNCRRVICATRVCHDDFISPKHAPYHLIDLFCLVEGDNVCRDFVHRIDFLSDTLMRRHQP